jgi:MarR family transcriptional regulator, organic hydroperoxide resistance regulator
MNKITEEEFRFTGLTPTYAFLLMTINEKQGITQKELGKIMHIAPSTTTRFIEKLLVKNLVYSEQRGRLSMIFSTDKGKALQKDIEKAWENLHKHYTNILGLEEGDDLTRHLYDVSEKLDSSD